ncbi:hypothetical protein ACWGLG_20685 [Streptomyces antimycoticus]
MTARERIAASRRLSRGFDRITALLDPARCDRRSRLPQEIADAYADAWNVPSGRQAAERLQLLASQLVLSPVRLAKARGYLRGRRGDIGVDATSIPVQADPAGCGSLLAALDVHPRIAMQILRHSKIAVTMEIYTHVPSEATRKALRRLGKHLGKQDRK